MLPVVPEQIAHSYQRTGGKVREHELRSQVLGGGGRQRGQQLLKCSSAMHRAPAHSQKSVDVGAMP